MSQVFKSNMLLNDAWAISKCSPIIQNCLEVCVLSIITWLNREPTLPCNSHAAVESTDVGVSLTIELNQSRGRVKPHPHTSQFITIIIRGG